jgi:MFS family permease
MAGYNTRALFRRVDHLLNKDLAYDFLTDVEYKGSGIENDPFIVDGMLRDSVNPLEFTSNRKWGFAFISSISALSVAFASSVYSGGSKSIISDFDALQHVVILGLSLFVLGLAIGPLLWGPLSGRYSFAAVNFCTDVRLEVYGRKYVFSFTYAVLTVFSVATVVAPNVQSLIIFRFLAGAFGSSYQTNAGGVIADMFEAGERGLALTIFAAAPFLGPVIGPTGTYPTLTFI